MACLRDFLPPVKDASVAAPSSVADRTVTEPISTLIAPAPPDPNAGLSKTIALPINSQGRPDFSAVVKQGENATKYVHTGHEALVEKPRSAISLTFPSEEQALETDRRTRAALQVALAKKLKTPDTSKSDTGPKYIRYTPANGGGARVVKMVTAQVDPMEPPRFAQKKAPMNPPSPPVPVLHSPERKLSKEEVDEWKIPPVVSNWKNARGYTVPLDKRLAARGNTEPPPLNDRLAEFADALYTAERQARADVEKRAQLQRAVSLRQKEEKDNELRNLAQLAREGRADTFATTRRPGIERPTRAATPHTPSTSFSGAYDDASSMHFDGNREDSAVSVELSTATGTERRRKSRFDIGPGGVRMTEPTVSTPSVPAEADDDMGARARDEVRRERREQREREMRQRERHGDANGPTLKRTKLTRDRDRDVSERVALGQSAAAARGGEVLYDQRLFNQGERDAGRAFGSEDGYNVYDKALFKERPTSSFLYRPKDAVLGNQAPTASGDGARKTRDERPVEFERDTDAGTGRDADPFGLDKFLTDARRGRSEKKY